MKHGAYEDHGGPYLVLDPRLAITVRSSTGELEWEGMGTLSVMTNVDTRQPTTPTCYSQSRSWSCASEPHLQFGN